MRPHPALAAKAAALWFAAALLTAATPLQAAAPQRPPNIVFIMADELGYYELSCMGHPHIQTPNIDAMAAQGLRFTQCLAGSPLCAPTRGTLLTGKHTGHTSVRTNGGGTPLRLEEPTFATTLRAAGYATGGFGKWGCGGRGSSGVPEKHGFDTFVGYYDQVHAHSYYPPYIVRNSEEIPLPGNRGGSDGETYAHYEIVDAARSFIREHAGKKPFLCYLPVTPPHGIFDIPDDDPAWKLYATKAWPEQARRYAAMVTMLDRQVGELLELLKELGVADDTIVFFCGDNGGNDYFGDETHPRGFHAPNVDPRTGVAFRGKKGQVYEGGLRVPMVAYWPGHVRQGAVTDHLCSFPDVYPTLCELAGDAVPDGAMPSDLDGISLVPTLLGEDVAGRAQERHDYLYWELGVQRAVRKGSWKAVRRGDNRAWELYDLRTDVSEAEDVSKDHPDVVEQLAALADEAHEPVREGDWGDRSLHEKDRRAKGGNRGRQPRGPVDRLPKSALDRTGWRIVSSSSEMASTGKHAANVLDGDPRTHWHTRFGTDLAEPPHHLLIDMGAVHEVRSLLVLARQDAGWNGAFGEVEWAVGDDPEALKRADAAGKATLRRERSAQRIDGTPGRGRYLLVRVLSEAGGGPWASAAEIGAVGTR